MGVDLSYADVGLCHLAMYGAFYRGERVSLQGRTRLASALRPRIRLGGTLTIGEVHVEPTLGVGMIHAKDDLDGYPERRVWNVWAGGSVTLRSPDYPFGLEIEYGVHQVRQRYEAGIGGEGVREFNLWEPLFRLSVVR